MVVSLPGIEFSDYVLVRNSLIILCNIKSDKSIFLCESNHISMIEKNNS